MNVHDYYQEELATKKTLSSKKGFLTKSENQIKEHLQDLLDGKKEGPHGNMKYAYLHGEPITAIRISTIKTELKVVQNLKKQIENMKNSGLKKPTVRGLKKICTHVVRAIGLKVDGTLKKGYKYAAGGKIVKVVAKKVVAKKKPVAKKKVVKKPVPKKKPVAKKKPAAKKTVAKKKLIY